MPLLKGFIEQKKARFTVIGAGRNQLEWNSMTLVPWSEETEVAELKKLDVGIMPLSDGSFERGKCGYKIIQYMACGLPVIASPVGINRQLIEDGENGFLAETLEEWSVAISRLIESPSLRMRMGMAGLEKVKKRYCIQVTGPRLIELLKDVFTN